jgi:SAM-dependent methyltransferase
MNKLIKFLQSCSRQVGRILTGVPGMRRAYTWVRTKVIIPAVLRLLDRWYGLETEGDIKLEELGIDPTDRQIYRPSSWFTLTDISRVIPFSKDDVFVDFGSGKGRMVFLAALHPFRRIVGVEISEVLNQVARKNIQKNLRRLKCRDIELITSDVLAFSIPADMTIAYFFNPFGGEIFRRVLQHIRESYEQHPRHLWVIYMSSQPNMYLEESGWLRRVALVGNSYIYEAPGPAGTTDDAGRTP